MDGKKTALLEQNWKNFPTANMPDTYIVVLSHFVHVYVITTALPLNKLFYIALVLRRLILMYIYLSHDNNDLPFSPSGLNSFNNDLLAYQHVCTVCNVMITRLPTLDACYILILCPILKTTNQESRRKRLAFHDMYICLDRMTKLNLPLWSDLIFIRYFHVCMSSRGRTYMCRHSLPTLRKG